ncbi:MAG: threonylcarbamoyl-AMP synthase [Calditrichaeota bacterium]|nr:threonylcarbamoyl-AMP synthase [Calditrichota bacterium]
MNIVRIDPNVENPNIVQEAIELVRQGKIVAHPTETVYGLATDAFNERALDRIFDIKKRDYTRPLSIMVDSIERIEEIIGEIDKKHRKILEHFLPGPITFILPVRKKILNPYFRQFTKIGFRIPDHKFCRELLVTAQMPLITTSANRSGLKNPQLAIEIATNFGKEVDLIIDGGKTKTDVASTVVDLSTKKVEFIREGTISKKKWAAELKKIK